MQREKKVRVYDKVRVFRVHASKDLSRRPVWYREGWPHPHHLEWGSLQFLHPIHQDHKLRLKLINCFTVPAPKKAMMRENLSASTPSESVLSRATFTMLSSMVCCSPRAMKFFYKGELLSQNWKYLQDAYTSRLFDKQSNERARKRELLHEGFR